MAFKQKLFLNTVQLKVSLEKLLEVKIQDIIVDYQSDGSTGNVNKITIITDQLNQSFLLKKVENSTYYSLYKDVLSKYGLNHPEIYEELHLPEGRFLLMQWIPQVKNEWEKKDYLNAIKWLTRKDLLLIPQINTLKTYKYIQKNQTYLQSLKEERYKNLESGEKEYPEIFRRVSRYSISKLAEETYELLLKEPLTICHNDFCKNNILFTEKDEVYVIDWTGPYVASVGVDLGEILNNASEEYQKIMLEKYIELTGFDNVKGVIKSIQLNNQINHVNWRIKRLLRGDEKYSEVKEELVEITNTISTNL
jgi:thiamine kinase-like enzyme